jgi:hypothetical protein
MTHVRVVLLVEVDLDEWAADMMNGEDVNSYAVRRDVKRYVRDRAADVPDGNPITDVRAEGIYPTQEA